MAYRAQALLIVGGILFLNVSKDDSCTYGNKVEPSKQASINCNRLVLHSNFVRQERAMTSISSTTYQPAYQSPLTTLQNELSSEVSAGTISTSDQSALSSALNDINSALQGSASSTQASSPSDIKSKIDGLIASEVKSGKLTSDQATELQSVFSNAFSQGGPGGLGGAGGPPPGGPPSGAGGSNSDTSSSSSDSGSSTSSDATTLLKDFLKLLKDSTAANASYGSNSQPTNNASTSLLINYQS